MSPAQTPETIEHEQHALPAPKTQKSLPEPEKSGGGMKKFLLILVVLGLVGFAVWRIHKNNLDQQETANKDMAKADKAIPVSMSAVQSKTMPIYLTALGTVTAYYSVTIKSRVDGELMTVNVREGQAVKKGQVLAEIDPRPYQAALAQAEGQLAKDQASANYAKAESARYTALYQAGVVSKDSEQTQVSNAGQTAGSIQADLAAIQAAKVNVTYTRIISPIDGVVGLRQVDPGNIVHASDATGLLLVTQLHPISVIFTLPEDQLPQVQQTMGKGAKLAVEAYDRSETTHLADGSLLTLDNQIDTTTGTLKVKAVFDNTDNTLFPNQFVNVRLILQQRPNSIVIPAAALQTGTTGNFVYVVKEGTPPVDPSAPAKTPKIKAPAASSDSSDADSESSKGPKYYVEVRPVVVDLTEGTQVILKSGVNAGEQVVVDGQEKLKNHSKVSPKKAAKTSKTVAAAADSSGGPGASSTASTDATTPPAGSADPGTSPKSHKKGQ